MMKKTGKGRCTMQVSKGMLVMLLVMLITGGAMASQATPWPVVVNGSSVAPVGWFLYENITNTDPAGDNYGSMRIYPLDDSKAHSLDCVMQYKLWDDHNGDWTQSQVDSRVLNYLDEAAARGVELMVEVQDFDIIKSNLPELTRRVNLVKNHSALQGYYLSDEPGMQAGAPSAGQLIAAYNTIHSADANHPVLIVATPAIADPGSYNYLGACDVFYRDLYPINNTMSGDDLATNYTAEIEVDVNNARGMSQNYSILRQAFDRETHNGKIYPTALQYRYLVYAPISVGATGDVATFMFNGYEFEDNAPNETYREDIVYPTLDELLTIRSLILQGSSGLTVTSTVGDVDFLTGKTLDKVTYIMCGSGSSAVLIAVNNTNAALSNVDFNLSGLDAGIDEAYVVGEDRIISLSSNSFTDSFSQGYEVHVYRFQDRDWSVPIDCAEAKAAGYSISSDVNGDCIVNLSDFANLAEGWMDCRIPFDSSCSTPWF